MAVAKYQTIFSYIIILKKYFEWMFSFQYPGQISIQKKGFQRVNTEMPGERISRAQLHSSGINGEFGQVTP